MLVKRDREARKKQASQSAATIGGNAAAASKFLSSLPFSSGFLCFFHRFSLELFFFLLLSLPLGCFLVFHNLSFYLTCLSRFSFFFVNFISLCPVLFD